MTLGLGSLTQHSDEGLGSSHGHGEDGAGVLALVGQGHVADADAELVGCGFHQLNPIISKGCGEVGIESVGRKAFTGTFHVYLPAQVSFFGGKGYSAIWGRGEIPLLSFNSL